MKELTRIAERLLDLAQKAGADSAQCTVSSSEKREFNVDGGEFSLMRTLFDAELRLSVLVSHRQGSVTLNRLDDEALAQAAKSAVESAQGSEPDEAREYAADPIERSWTDGAVECDTEKLFFRTKELLEGIRDRHPKILVEQMIVDHVRSQKVYENTNGVRYLSEADLLTGTKNRNSYENSLQGYGKSCKNNVICLYADVNGLHEMNNAKGHKAGDEMLQAAAKEIMGRFGREDTYRVGGDEFVAFRVDGDLETARRDGQEIARTLLGLGYNVSVGVAASDKTGIDMLALTRDAESEMFEEKHLYYQQAGHDRRRR